ncbi:MAG: hypothetical protein MUO72_03895 [Bacteroidales bacterium]|nr:hypothetical protein [Bacteroidales bacterium]
MRNYLFSLFILLSGYAAAQITSAKYPELVTFSTQQDHQNMMNQLGIKTLRPGPSGNESAPNHANYNVSKANPYPVLPDVLTLKNGKKVTTPEQWWNQRRPEIVEDMEREVYGRLPKNIPPVTWKVEIEEREFVGRFPVIAKQLVGHVDNSDYPLINVDIKMTVVTPADAEAPVPVLMMFGYSVLPAPVQPNPDDLNKLNAALRELLARDPEINMKEMIPAVNVDMLNGELAWRQHDGGHTDTPNISHFVTWAKNKLLK